VGADADVAASGSLCGLRWRAKKLSPASSPGGGETSVWRWNSASICRCARRTVAVDAITLGRDQCPGAGSPTGQPVHRSLVEADQGAERPGDQVQSWLVRRAVCRLTSKDINRLVLDLLRELDSSARPSPAT